MTETEMMALETWQKKIAELEMEIVLSSDEARRR